MTNVEDAPKSTQLLAATTLTLILPKKMIFFNILIIFYRVIVRKCKEIVRKKYIVQHELSPVTDHL